MDRFEEKMADIPGAETFTKIEPLNKGWSADRKYCIETADGRRLLLRVADIAQYDRKRAEYGMLRRVAELDVPASRPVAFGLCNDGRSVYQLLTWVDGADAESLLPTLTETEQYALGVKAGETLRRMHALPAPDGAEDWGARFARKVQARVDFYHAHPIQSESGDILVRYLQDNRHLLSGRPQVFNHGDYNTTNMIVGPDGSVGVIDFNCYNSDHGDPWWEFDPGSWGNEPNAPFATGLFNGYFGGPPPTAFFAVRAYYSAYDALAALCDTSIGDQGEPEDGRRHVENTLRWFDNMRNPVPTWYLKDFYVQYIDGVPLKLKAPFDLSFLGRYGRVFKVFDDQDSGNLCFGVQKGDARYFVKFAGGPAEQYRGTPEDAVARLKTTIPVYRDLAHPTLIHFLEAEEIGNGFAVVFDWVDATCMHRMYPRDHLRFKQASPDVRMRIFEDILAFHSHVAEQGYVAIDFYDGSILYDFENGKTILCDIDFYAKQPYTNRMGRMWGSSRFLSPEEFTLGAQIDEVTNVYTMGATAFALFSESDRSPGAWPLSRELYAVAKRAISDERGRRQQSIHQLMEEWKAAREP